VTEADKTEEAPSCYVLMKVTVDNFTGDIPTKDDMKKLASYFAQKWSQTYMSDTSLITYEGMPVGEFMWMKEEDLPEGWNSSNKEAQ